jgi:hypothetical protein
LINYEASCDILYDLNIIKYYFKNKVQFVFVPNKTMLNNIQRKIIMCISNYYHAAISMLPAIDIYNNINVYII